MLNWLWRCLDRFLYGDIIDREFAVFEAQVAAIDREYEARQAARLARYNEEKRAIERQLEEIRQLSANLPKS